MNDFNASIIKEFRANAGVVGGPFEGAPLLLLGTTGAKTGNARVNPLAYLRDGERWIVIASYAGASSNPPWYYNLIADPQVTVEVSAEPGDKQAGIDQFEALATVIDEPERTQLYEKMATAMPAFADYQTKTSRVIPVIALTKR